MDLSFCLQNSVWVRERRWRAAAPGWNRSCLPWFLSTFAFNRYCFYAQKWKRRDHRVPSKPAISSFRARQAHSLFQKQWLQLWTTGSFTMWGLISLPELLLPGQTSSCCCSSALGSMAWLFYTLLPIDLELLFFLFPLLAGSSHRPLDTWDIQSTTEGSVMRQPRVQPLLGANATLPRNVKNRMTF